ncbi:GvpL/GvpF family gas vesicle protein [Actinomadura barringtoniae]|uniref:GvpL/GvpF family gas vesicle protein n=1 Tax=Actinomadura barringtoniae TaxID=1427535 RepID=A0A939PIK2_9ACTN|nr:GvpL/GvpF family gas vesicle protein [Actinomadura barringtoniae]MBO2450723.1 GvpL/GvpF family gas vesicle protein [Actinomadura barringtoniae]
MTDTAVYLYGVARDVENARMIGVAGVSGSPVRAVSAAGLTALVSTVRTDDFGEEALRVNLEDLTFLEETARAHHDVVDRAARWAPTVPVRIATLYRDDARVAEVLVERKETFGRALDSITGRSEWGVKAYAYPDAEPEPEPEPEPQPGGGTGTAYLRRRQAQRNRVEDGSRRRIAQAEAVHAELADYSVASRQHPAQDPRLSQHEGVQILNVAYLLDEAQVDPFLAVVQDVDTRLPGIGLEVTGPWPPYSFIDET